MNNNEKYLPIGTVVRLKDGKKNIMITGFCPISADDGIMRDYSACLYPEGVVSSEFNLLFDHEQIDEILFKGFVSSEETTFKLQLNQIISQKMASGELPPSSQVGITGGNTMNQQPVQPVNNNAQPQMFSNNNN